MAANSLYFCSSTIMPLEIIDRNFSTPAGLAPSWIVKIHEIENRLFGEENVRGLIESYKCTRHQGFSLLKFIAAYLPDPNQAWVKEIIDSGTGREGCPVTAFKVGILANPSLDRTRASVKRWMPAQRDREEEARKLAEIDKIKQMDPNCEYVRNRIEDWCRYHIEKELSAHFGSHPGLKLDDGWVERVVSQYEQSDFAVTVGSRDDIDFGQTWVKNLILHKRNSGFAKSVGINPKFLDSLGDLIEQLILEEPVILEGEFAKGYGSLVNLSNGWVASQVSANPDTPFAEGVGANKLLDMKASWVMELIDRGPSAFTKGLTSKNPYFDPAETWVKPFLDKIIFLIEAAKKIKDDYDKEHRKKSGDDDAQVIFAGTEFDPKSPAVSQFNKNLVVNQAGYYALDRYLIGIINNPALNDYRKVESIIPLVLGVYDSNNNRCGYSLDALLAHRYFNPNSARVLDYMRQKTGYSSHLGETLAGHPRFNPNTQECIQQIAREPQGGFAKAVEGNPYAQLRIQLEDELQLLQEVCDRDPSLFMNTALGKMLVDLEIVIADTGHGHKKG
jgi:hypothetical protein